MAGEGDAGSVFTSYIQKKAAAAAPERGVGAIGGCGMCSTAWHENLLVPMNGELVCPPCFREFAAHAPASGFLALCHVKFAVRYAGEETLESEPYLVMEATVLGGGRGDIDYQMACAASLIGEGSRPIVMNDQTPAGPNGEGDPLDDDDGDEGEE